MAKVASARNKTFLGVILGILLVMFYYNEDNHSCIALINKYIEFFFFILSKNVVSEIILLQIENNLF